MESNASSAMEADMTTDEEKKVTITVADIMTKRVIYLREEDNLTIISKGMERYNLRHLPVVSDDKLMGIVTHRDLLRLAVSSIETSTPEGKMKQEKLDESTFVASVMTQNPVTVSPDTPIWEAARIIIDNKFGCLPVIDKDSKLVGIVTEHDFLKTLAH
ncbi:MAG: CBS domain-containing protein [Deltaproteobacteria bacterium]|nr:CBS domain-containing protein [Deltaproteobacteria bacterium]